MLRLIKELNAALVMIVGVTVVTAGPSLARDAEASDQVEVLNKVEVVVAAPRDRPAVLISAPSGRALRVQGGPSSIRMDVHRITVEGILSALVAAYNVSHTSSIALDDVRDGSYSGSLGQVISRLLDGYDYIIRREADRFDITVLGKSGEQATPSPGAPPAVVHHVPTTARVSRNR